MHVAVCPSSARRLESRADELGDEQQLRLLLKRPAARILTD